MKPGPLTIVAGVIGLSFGLVVPGITTVAPQATATPVRSGPHRAAQSGHAWTTAGLTAAERTRRLADKAASLTAKEWPAFFRAQLRSPEWTPLAARMWAEADPEGFWNWLKGQSDTSLLMEWGPELLGTWTLTDPDAAMAAALKITNKEFSDVLRRKVVETALARDLTTGLRLATLTGDFNSFSSGQRDWMTKDPQAAVLGLAALPRDADYRDFLNSAVEVWAKADPRAALAWLSTQHHDEDEHFWFLAFDSGFKAAAAADPQATLAIARSLPDANARDAALGAVLATGKVPPQEVAGLLESCSLLARAKATPDAISALARTDDPAALATAVELLPNAPANKQTLYATATVARTWAERDWQGGWDWATSLPDPAMRRQALAALVGGSKAPPEQLAAMLAALPPLALSNDLISAALARIPNDRREAWLANLPPHLAAWASQSREGHRSGK